jgi:hypothetical protein
MRLPVARVPRAAAALAILVAALPAAAWAQAVAPRGGDTTGARRAADSAFAAVQARGADARAMGVDQYTSVHRFDALGDGGRIELRRVGDDSAGVATIRAHLRQVAAAFAAGDFRTPAFVHAQRVPGTAVLAAKRGVVTYAYRDLPRGGEVRIATRDPEALRAVHAFIAFQRQDHRAGGAGAPQHTPGAHPHTHRHPAPR